jgi:hypothetical protein
MGRRLADCDAVEDGSAGPVNLVDPLAEPVAVVDDIKREVGPHVVWVIPHTARLHSVDFALDRESCCVEHGDCSGLKDTAPIPLVSYTLELSIHPDLAHAWYRRPSLRSRIQNIPLGTLVGIGGSDCCENRKHSGRRE